MKLRVFILYVLLLGCQILSAQNYYMQYTHDTLGNRTGRIRGVLTREMEAEGISADTTLRIIAFPDSVSQPFCFENTSQEGKEDDESSIKHGYLIKTKSEKEEFLRELVSITDTLKPIRKEGTRDISSYDVGAIPLQYGVSSAGARTYTVPIATAPDIKYPPSISLSYNSLGGYGSGGYGWSLGGIPSLLSKNSSGHWHAYNDTEQDANIRAFNYFKQYYPKQFDGIKLNGQYNGEWHFDDNPIGLYGNMSYNALIDSSILSTKLVYPTSFDYALFCLMNPLPATIIGGIIHTIINNSKY